MQSPRTTLSLFLSLSLVLDCFTLSQQCSIASLSLDDSADERMPPPPEDEFAALSRALATLRDRHSGAILTDEFLEVCRGVLPVIGELFSPFLFFRSLSCRLPLSPHSTLILRATTSLTQATSAPPSRPSSAPTSAGTSTGSRARGDEGKR